ncbi:MAG: response regulator [Chloroflexota bacterium]|nr:response regulator [Chloroflexota bacterium]
MHIAIIEDDPGLREMMTVLLGDEGFTVIAWSSGVGAHAMTLRERPDLLLLDLRLEESRAGMAVLDEIRNDPHTRDTAVIVCSGDVHFLREHGARLRAQGCGVIEKPFDIGELIAMIRGFAPTPGATDRAFCF